MRMALGLTAHTGWAACVLAGGSVRDPHLEVREHLALVADDDARFVFHRAAELPRADAAPYVVLASHPRIHTAEGIFYRDVLADAARAAGMRALIIAPSEVDAKDSPLTAVGRAVGKPWNQDWKLAALAAWRVLA